MKNILVTGAVLLSSSLFALAQTPTKVGIINIQAAIIGTREGQAAAKDLEAKSAPKKRDLEKLQLDINGLKDKLGKLSSVGSEDQKNGLMRDIDAKTKSFNRQVEDAQAELDQEQGRLLNELGGKVLAVLDKYAKDNAFAIILDVSAQNTPVMFAANGIDVTQEVVALYDKNAPGASSAAPPAAAPAATKPAAIKPAAPRPAGAK
ncbi:MAG: OmpH family outer membrane protein [Bryobacteraceae bacterium]|nr:OmpH family outer membrane protein [Bryobacteraceae bacterium]